jgi:hypothetical protein
MLGRERQKNKKAQDKLEVNLAQQKINSNLSLARKSLIFPQKNSLRIHALYSGQERWFGWLVKWSPGQAGPRPAT